MRTRRSPRNQEILWRALGDVKPAERRSADEVEIARRMLVQGCSPRDRKHYERVLAREELRLRVQAHLRAEVQP